ncbi:MAG: hypothetical protein AAGE84_17460 [Cyanobacteria bacterium P01_G01_bin.39]
MSIELHNFTWKGVRLVQIETSSQHLAGVLSNIRETLKNSDCEWEDIYSAYYDSEEDATTTFYEGESAEAGNPGIWTYVVYDCNPGEEEVVANLDIDTLDPALKLRRIVTEMLAVSSISNSSKRAQSLRDIAIENGISPEALLSIGIESRQNNSQHSFSEAANYVINKNAELYRRLA